ncbi:MAG TPA: hypothetical protein VN830_09155 [Verrucomicrobiae bacterium]|nr:hypothetical protein [Verrucomicrobiae bacterium]
MTAIRRGWLAWGLIVGGLWVPGTVVAQEQQEQASTETQARTNAPERRLADGERHGLPLEVYGVAPGTRFLVKLEEEMTTRAARQNQEFRVRTLEPLEAGQGIYLPAGALIIGHISRVEPAGLTGRAKLWLTFDEIHTRFGSLPLVADVVAVPGDHSIKPGAMQEGVIEGRGGTQKDATQAAATGAAVGALKGVKDKNAKEGAQAAALGALEAYLAEAGRGQELDLPKGAKLELELGRALYLVKE